MEDSITLHDAVAIAPDPPPSVPASPAKWAAVVDDVLVPLPRRHVPARLILDQARYPRKRLIRDYDTPFDVGFAQDAEVDLADGNVFRLSDDCTCHPNPEHTAPPKLAFIVDDAWQVTINPHQTSSSLRDLFALSPGVELLRDLDSPTDTLIEDADEIVFADGPVFRTERHDVTVRINTKPVTLDHRRVTALQLKEAAIAQHVAIETGFNLYRILADDSLSPVIANDVRLRLIECEAFRCVAPDDNS